MIAAAPIEPRVRVLSNTIEVRSNPWLASWLEASRSAGVDVEDLSLSAVLDRGDRAPDGAHLQWPERTLNPASPVAAGKLVARLLLLCAVLRVRGRRVLWTAHNAASHDQRHPLLERVLWFGLDRLVTDVHALAGAGRDEVVAAHPPLARRRWHVIPLGDYLDQTSAAPSREEARAALDVPADARVLSSFGMLRRYKGVDDLLDAFGRWPAPDAQLVVAGRATPAEADDLHAAAGTDDRVRLTTTYVDDKALLDIVIAADLVVLPYRAVLNSSSAFYALSAERPVLVPRTPTFVELSERVGYGWVRTYDGRVTAEVLSKALQAPMPVGSPELGWCSWNSIADGIATMWDVR